MKDAPTRFVALAALFLAPLLVPLAEGATDAPPKPLTVLAFRHAETAGSTRSGGDPELSDGGAARAEALARLLANSGVTHVFSSEFARTQATIAPLAEQLGLEIQVVPADDGAAQVDALLDLPPGSIAAVCGHSNTVPGIVSGLGGEARDLVEHPKYGGMLEHESYDRLFVVTRPTTDDGASGVQTIELRYGD